MIQKLLIAACFCACLLPFNAFCEAEVVDDSENFALLEEQQASYESPVAHDDRVRYDDRNPGYERALAKDDRATGNMNNAGLLDKIQGMQQDIQELRGQLEVQAHDLKLLQEQQLSFYKDLDERLRGSTTNSLSTSPSTHLDTVPKPVAPPTSTSTALPLKPVINTTRGNPADEQISYLAAYELVKNKHFDEGLTAMQTFVAKYPHGGYSANAQYWLGELYMVKSNYPQAIDHFNVVLQEFPSSSKGAASLLKIGYALAASGKTAEARVKLQEVVKTYPDTSTAKLANAKLNALKN